MDRKITNWFRKEYPENYLILRPFRGALITTVYCFLFVVFYRPLDIHPNDRLSFELSMAIYAFICGLSHIFLVYLLKRLAFFSARQTWTVGREILAILFILTGMSIIIYFAGFLVEGPTFRWNFQTFFNSCKIIFLIGIILFGFFSAMNSRYWNGTSQQLQGFSSSETNDTKASESLVQINSQLKKEKLCFYPSQLIYAVSDSNYVIFYLANGEEIRKEIIRNSISEVSKQLEMIPHFIRTHRAFIVNLEKIREKKGNSQGYRLQLEGVSEEIPVSRNHTKSFERQLANLLNPRHLSQNFAAHHKSAT